MHKNRFFCILTIFYLYCNTQNSILMRKVLQLLIFFTTTALFAQLPQHLLKSGNKLSKYDKYSGSVYVHKEAQPAHLTDESTSAYDIKLNYNIYNDALEYKTGDELFEITKNPTIYARINNDYYYYCNFKTQKGTRKNGYYILVELNDAYRIYKKHELKITDPVEMETMPGNMTMGKIKLVTTFYLEENETIMELPLNKKDILFAFADKENELKEYIKKEKIKLKKEEDLLRLVAKYNALKNINSNLSQSLLSSTVRNN